MRNLLVSISVLLAVFAGAALIMNVSQRINDRANSKLIFPIQAGDRISFLAVVRSGEYAVASVAKDSRLGMEFSAATEISGIEVRIAQDGVEVFDGPLKRLQWISVGGYDHGPVTVDISYAEDGATEAFVMFGRPL